MTAPNPQPNTFNVSRWKSGDPLVSMTIGEQSELSEVIEAFELFLIAIGYSLPEGAGLGFEYEDDADGHFHHESYCRKCNPNQEENN